MRNLILLLFILFVAKAHAFPAATDLNILAAIPESCAVTLRGSISPAALGMAITSQSLQRFIIPIGIECNAPGVALKARPFALTSVGVPNYEVFYHVNSSDGVSGGLGWVNTSWDQPGIIANYASPVQKEIDLYLEGFKEKSNRQLPAGNYSGVVQLIIGSP